MANKFWMFVDVVPNVPKPKMNCVETIGTGLDDVPPDYFAKVMAHLMDSTLQEDFVPK